MALTEEQSGELFGVGAAVSRMVMAMCRRRGFDRAGAMLIAINVAHALLISFAVDTGSSEELTIQKAQESLEAAARRWVRNLKMEAGGG